MNRIGKIIFGKFFVVFKFCNLWYCEGEFIS